MYNRIESLIRNKIVSGRLQSGEKLPSEEELGRHYGVSRITVRNALGRLEQEGLILRDRGRGTFVADDIPVRKQFVLTGGIHEIVLEAEKYDVRALGIQEERVSDARYATTVRDFFDCSMNDSIHVVRRVRLLKGVPIYYLENFIRGDLARHLSKQELALRPLLKILKEKARITVGRGEMYIEAVPAEPDVAEVLHSQIFEPLILLTVFYWLKSGAPMEVVNCFMRPDFFKYRVDIDAEGFERI
jgi:GntR family transcriptional regulator